MLPNVAGYCWSFLFANKIISSMSNANLWNSLQTDFP